MVTLTVMFNFTPLQNLMNIKNGMDVIGVAHNDGPEAAFQYKFGNQLAELGELETAFTRAYFMATLMTEETMVVVNQIKVLNSDIGRRLNNMFAVNLDRIPVLVNQLNQDIEDRVINGNNPDAMAEAMRNYIVYSQKILDVALPMANIAVNNGVHIHEPFLETSGAFEAAYEELMTIIKENG